jgi:CheY-like chemotaxis protein
MPDSPKLLLVDDEDANKKLLTFPLQRDGYRVVEARDGEIAPLAGGEEQEAASD